MNPRIAVLGDIMLDTYHFAYERSNPERSDAPCFTRRHSINRAGGAANVASNLTKLGAEVTLIGLIGTDEAGDILLNEISRNCSTEGILRSPKIKTIVKQRVISLPDQVYRIRLDFGDTPEEVATIYSLNQEIIGDVEGYLRKNFDAYAVSDYAKGFITHDLMDLIRLKKGKAPAYVDPKQNINLYQGVDLIKPNRGELISLLGSNGRGDEDNAETLADLLNSDVLLTRGELGMHFVGRDKNKIDVAAYHQQNPEVTGCGDTVLATVIFYRALGMGWEQTLNFANKAAAINTQHVGCYQPTRQEIESFK